MDFFICEKCNGSGLVEKQKCPNCHGRGVYSWFDGRVLFLSQKFDRDKRALLVVEKFLKTIVRITLFIIGLAGLVCFIKIITGLFGVEIEILNSVFPFLGLESEDIFIIFWLSVLIDCYLIYLFGRDFDKKQKIWAKSVINNFPPQNWDEAVNFFKQERLEVTEAFSDETIKLIRKSWKLANKLSHFQISPLHIFAACLQTPKIILVINRLGIDWKDIREKVIKALDKLPKSNKEQEVFYDLDARKVFLNSYALAVEKKQANISVLDVLESMVGFDGQIKDFFYDLEIGQDEIKNVCLWIKIYEELAQQYHHFVGRARFKPKGPINRAYTAIATPNLDAYSQDLTQLAGGGYLNLCIGRSKEIDEIFRITESGRSGVILVGQPGVGRTTIISGLAQRMVTEEVPKILQDKRLISLSLSNLVAGASHPGECEKRLQIILNEVVRSGNIILFIKDIHNMIGVKTTEGELDIAEMLGEFVKKYSILIFATSTPNEYRKLIEPHSLGGAFQKVNIEETDKNTTIQILEAKAASIESKEKVYFSYGALASVFDMSSRYIVERFLPEKAINLLKEVAMVVKNKRGGRTIIKGEDVAELISEKTKIPLTRLTEKESEKLLNLEEQIHQRLIDQNEAVNMVASALRRARTELRNLKKPIVNLLFLGPTGVGKTELAKTVAEVYFGHEDRMIRLDMSEYQEKNSIDRLIGTPGGEQGGQLTEMVRLNPSSLLLLDEIEKAHPDILNVFLQVMDDGRLTDATGRTVNFANIIIIGTSNAGTDFIQEEINKGSSVEKITEILVREKLKFHFRSEFLNRFDGVIVFKPLGREEIKQIAKLQLKKLAKQLESKGIILKLTDDAINEITEAGFDPAFGARPLNRVIQNKVSDVLAKFLLTGKVGRRDTVVLEKNGAVRIEKAEKI